MQGHISRTAKSLGLKIYVRNVQLKEWLIKFSIVLTLNDSLALGLHSKVFCLLEMQELLWNSLNNC